MRNDSSSAQRSGAQTVERAFLVLRTVADSATPLGVTELAQRAGLTVSTTHRLARVLAEAGMFAQEPHSERYQLGPALIALGNQAAERLGYDRALPFLQQLAEASNESVNLGIRSGNDVHVVLQVASRQPLRFDQRPGTAVPLHVSAMGKCLLAGAGDIDAVVDDLGELSGPTDRSITDRERLRDELHTVQDRGWALNDEERIRGVRSVAVPVIAPGAGVVAAIAVQGPTVQLVDDRLPDIVALLRQTAESVAPILTPGLPVH